MTEPGSPTEQGDVVDFVSRITDSARFRIEENLPHGYVRLKVAEAERRQAQHDIRSVEDIVTELVRNSRDAGARHVVVGFQKEQGRYRKIVVLDDGCGIPHDMHEMVFEPRVTSKSADFEEDRYGVHGRGMALFSIRSRAMEARIVSSGEGAGAAMSVEVDTRKVPERSDQATLPRLEDTPDGMVVGAGPHNVARVLVEMSVDHPGVEFCMGSFSEALARARALALSGDHEGPWAGLEHAADARALAEFGRDSLGLPVSERNAYRVIAGEIAATEDLYRQAHGAADLDKDSAKLASGSRARAGTRPRSALRRLSREDLAQIGEECTPVVEKVTGRYYLKPEGPPRVRRARGRITISFSVSGEGESD